MNMRKTKPTRKPGLTPKMREARLKFAMEHKDWTEEDWKKVIWSDETSVVIGQRRGGYRVWRTPEEAFTSSCVRNRWKGYSEFMFWGAFSWDAIGPSHCWQRETAAEKRKSLEVIEQLNKELELIMKAEWEKDPMMGSIGLNNKPTKRGGWSFKALIGKLARFARGGIDWYRY